MNDFLSGKVEKWISKAIESVIIALVIGFFVIIWTASTSIDTKIAELNKRTDEANKALQASTDTLSLEVAKLHVAADKIATLEKRLEFLSKHLKELRDYINANKTNSSTVPSIGTETIPSPDPVKRFGDEENRIRQNIKDRTKS